MINILEWYIKINILIEKTKKNGKINILINK
jgi:hypothetical protein